MEKFVLRFCCCVYAASMLGIAVAQPDLPPIFKELYELRDTNPELLAQDIVASPLAVIREPVPVPPRQPDSDSLPIVVAHGMGDSCFNSGMESVTKAAGAQLGVYSVCIPTGDNWLNDTIAGFLLSMDKSVDVFAAQVWANPKLSKGFNAFGLSQGNSVIRGYITKYNNPPVFTYMSICGTNAGVAAFPNCAPDSNGVITDKLCKALAEVLGDFAYSPFFQDTLFQAGYYRDPLKLQTSDYLQNSELAQWNNEATINTTYLRNWARTRQFVWVMALNDTVVWPREGEWWGAPDPSDPFGAPAVPMAQTRWYTQDLFGLRSAQEAGKNHFEAFLGNHIQFSAAELARWLDKYFK